MEDLLIRHRKESKELQARITSKKKNATKKTRKGVNDECAELERQLKERHGAEIASLEHNGTSSNPSAATAEGGLRAASSSSAGGDGDDGIIDPFASEDPSPPAGLEPDLATSIAGLSVAQGGAGARAVLGNAVNGGTEPTGGAEPKRKGNRQKARLARRAAEQEAAVEEAASWAASLPDLRAKERAVVDAALRERGLAELEVRSDGHCLYAAMADQLAQVGVSLASEGGAGGQEEKGNGDEGGEKLPDYKVVRKEAARFVLEHQDDFVPFMDEDDLVSGGVEEYVRRIADTAEWGGQMEILACARRWGLVVNVLQGDGRVEKIEGVDGTKGAPEKDCWLVYYQHHFGLGQHYNSLRKT